MTIAFYQLPVFFSLDCPNAQYCRKARGAAPVWLLHQIAGKLRESGGALEVSR